MREAVGFGLLDANGRPFASGRAAMLAGGSGVPYDAADMTGSHMAAWQPSLWSPDGELNPNRDRIVSRVRDLVRNDGWASAAVTRTLDNVIGADFRPISKPDYYGLEQHTGIKAFDHKWAEEFGRAVEAHWRLWSNDTQKYCDVTRNQTVSQMMRLAFRHKIVDGDALALIAWLPRRGGNYSTALQIIDPDRLSNPQGRFDTLTMRGGVEIDAHGAAVAYHLRRAHQGDWFNASESVVWDRVMRETPWGRSIIIHDYDHDRGAQHRGGAGMLTPVVQRLKMLVKYDGTELDAAIINAIFGAYIESPYDQEMVAAAIDEPDEFNAYQKFRMDFHGAAKLKIGNVRMPVMAPGETINTVSAARPNSNFADFESAVLRNVAAGCGMSAQQISQNWSEVNYSSYRAAMLEAWKTFSRRRADFSVGFAQPIFAAFLEEVFDSSDLPLPSGAPDFIDFRGLYARAKWMGPGRGYVDDVKEKQGSILGMDACLSTLENEAATLGGHDWREILDQRRVEISRFEELDIPLPKWSGDADQDDADQTAKKQIKLPEAE